MFFPYLAQIIISIRGCVACNDLWPWPIFSGSFGLDLENRVRSVASIVLDGFFHIWYKWLLAWEGVLHVMTFDLDLYLQGHSTLFWLGIQHDSILWVIMKRRGVSSERKRSSWLSVYWNTLNRRTSTSTGNMHEYENEYEYELYSRVRVQVRVPAYEYEYEYDTPCIVHSLRWGSKCLFCSKSYPCSKCVITVLCVVTYQTMMWCDSAVS